MIFNVTGTTLTIGIAYKTLSVSKRIKTVKSKVSGENEIWSIKLLYNV